MSRSPDCCCHCSSTYNVRKLRISDGRTVWRRLVTYDIVTNEVQHITQTGTRTGGTFRLTFDGEETAAIPDGATAIVLEQTLQALSTIREGNVSCSGGPLATGVRIDIEFVGEFSGVNVPEITITESPEQYSMNNTLFGPVTQGSTVVLNQAQDCAYVDCACGETGRLVVGIGPSNAAVPYGLSSRTGDTFWTMPEDRLSQPELDSDGHNKWVGVFSENSLPLVSCRDAENNELWSRANGPLRPTASVRFGEETYLLLEHLSDGIAARFIYGDANSGAVIYDKSGYEVGQTFLVLVSKLFGINEEVAVVGPTNPLGDFSFEMFEIASRTQYQFAFSIVVDPVNDADWHRRNGEVEIFVAGGEPNTVSWDVLTNDAHTGNGQGLYRVLWKAGTWQDVRWILPTGSRPAKIWICSDGVVAISGESSFTIDGVTCEIFKCDFDLNVLWRKRWRGVGPGNGLRGLTGDADYVYISGGVGSWQCD